MSKGRRWKRGEFGVIEKGKVEKSKVK